MKTANDLVTSKYTSCIIHQCGSSSDIMRLSRCLVFILKLWTMVAPVGGLHEKVLVIVRAPVAFTHIVPPGQGGQSTMLWCLLCTTLTPSWCSFADQWCSTRAKKMNTMPANRPCPCSIITCTKPWSKLAPQSPISYSPAPPAPPAAAALPAPPAPPKN